MTKVEALRAMSEQRRVTVHDFRSDPMWSFPGFVDTRAPMESTP